MDNTRKGNWIKYIFITVLIITVISIIVLLYARYIGTKNIIVNEIKITETTLPNEFKGFKIVHISDIQYGTTTTEKELNELVEKINLTKPDIVVITGDLINKRCELNDDDIKILINFLNNIKADINKYAVSGENDILFSKYTDILKDGGFVNLDDTYDIIYNGTLNYILISGMGEDNKDLNKTKDYLEKTENQPVYKILLVHKPDTIDTIDLEFNLVLSGHHLGGLVKLPIVGPLYLEEGATKYYSDYYKINNSHLFASNGIGTNKYSFRLFNRPSFNFYRITNKQ